MSRTRIAFVFESREKMAEFMLAKWRVAAAESITKKGRFTVALSGGRTPKVFYDKLAEERGLSWDKTHIFLVDERCVPFDHSDSNFGMIRTTLLKRIAVPSYNVHPVPCEEAEPATAARKYEETIRLFFGVSDVRRPSFDLIMLGLGADGHTASLFPEMPEVGETRRLVRNVDLDQVRHNRITLTLPVINSARSVVFLVTGKDKAETLREVVEKKNEAMPASLVDPEEGDLLFLADADAGMLLSTEGQVPRGPAVP